MSDQTQAPPAVEEQASPSKSAREFVNQSDTDFLKTLGINTEEPKPEAKEPPKPEVKEPPKEAPKEVFVDEAPEVEAKTEKAEPEPEKPKKTYDFQIHDSQGELEVPEDLVLTFKANGKVRENVPLEKVVKFAEMGVYNHEREASIKQRETAVEREIMARQHVEQTMAELTAHVKRMLEDRDYAEAARERYLEYNAPENVTARTRQENERLRYEMHAQREAQIVATATQSQIAPVVDALLQKNTLVSQYEVLGRFQEMVAPYLVNGRLPASRLGNVVTLINNDLTSWAESVQEERATKEAERAKGLEVERREAQAMKRKLARATAPAQTGATPVESGQPKDFKSAKDWLNAAFPV